MSDQSASGAAGELHQLAGGSHPPMTNQRGVTVADDENMLRVGPRGPALLEDFLYIEKTQHFDHERIPERVVHARGYGAHGYFELTDSLKGISRAKVLTEVGVQTPVFVRFSTVAGAQGSPDLARDVRGFATKFYTSEGNWDLVGNNIPVFFIQDALKFTDLVHSVKEEPDRAFPQAASAHDTFWDFVSLTPESTHMLMWVMSDRAIPSSFRKMEGYGVHTFRLVNEKDESTFVKFHWRPKLGMDAVVWDEALKINGADPDFHRRDLWDNIEAGNFPEWELSVQLFDDAFAAKFDFDILDATKIIPEELIPRRVIGKMVLNRKVDNFFAETEQVAFCTANVVPGIDFSDDPLLMGRHMSYIDTQLSRLGSSNFNQIPINRPKTGCPFMNMQRDGHMSMQVPKGRVAYSPSSLDPQAPRADPVRGFKTFADPINGQKIRQRSPSFGDHFSQARMFFNSQTPVEQNHIISAFIFELSKVETKSVRVRMVGQLANVDPSIAARVAKGLGIKGPVQNVPTFITARTDLPESPVLSLLRNVKPGLATKKIGILIANGSNADEIKQLQNAITKQGAVPVVVAPSVGETDLSDGSTLEADKQLAGGPSVLFDAVFVSLSKDGAALLSKEAAAVAWVHDAYAHLKVIGASAESEALLSAAGVVPDAGVQVGGPVASFIDLAALGRIYEREPKVRTVF